MPPLSTTLAKLVAKFVAGIVDTSGKFATAVVDTGSNLPPVSLIRMVHLDFRISPRILEKFKTVLMGYSGAGGKMTHEKNQKQKISRDCPFKCNSLVAPFLKLSERTWSVVYTDCFMVFISLLDCMYIMCDWIASGRILITHHSRKLFWDRSVDVHYACAKM